MAWRQDRVQEEEVKLRMYSLPVLLYALAREEIKSTNISLSLSSLSGCDTSVPAISIAEVQLDRTMFIYAPGLSCIWHKDMETYLCTTDTVNRWSFIMFSLCCPLYGLELVPGKHCSEMVKTIAGSTATTTSVCPGNRGFFCEMGGVRGTTHCKSGRKLTESLQLEWRNGRCFATRSS